MQNKIVKKTSFSADINAYCYIKSLMLFCSLNIIHSTTAITLTIENFKFTRKHHPEKLGQTASASACKIDPINQNKLRQKNVNANPNYIYVAKKKNSQITSSPLSLVRNFAAIRCSKLGRIRALGRGLHVHHVPSRLARKITLFGLCVPSVVIYTSYSSQ